MLKTLMEKVSSLMETMFFVVSCVAFVLGDYSVATWLLLAAIYWCLSRGESK